MASSDYITLNISLALLTNNFGKDKVMIFVLNTLVKTHWEHELWQRCDVMLFSEISFNKTDIMRINEKEDGQNYGRYESLIDH